MMASLPRPSGALRVRPGGAADLCAGSQAGTRRGDRAGRAGLRRFGALCGAVACLASGARLAHADPFSDTQSRPTDHAASYRLIASSVAVRDYETAIGALEKLLLFNPGLSRAKYDLGALYFRLGAYDMATRYLEDAVADPALDADLRPRVAIMLPAARKELQVHRVYGVLQAGLRYNSNVTGGPPFSPVRAYGVDLINPYGAYQRGGVNAVVLGDVRYLYDFQNQRGDVWETRLSSGLSNAFSISAYDAALLEATTGPRLALAPEFLPGATVRPYLLGAYSLLGGGRYGSAYGVGVSARFPVGVSVTLEPGVEWRRAQVAGTTYALGAQTPYNTGGVWSWSLAARYQPTDWLTLDARGVYRRNSAGLAFLSSTQAGVEASAKFDYDAPFDSIGWRWSATPFVRYADVRFDSADPRVDPLVVRHDRQWRFGAQFDMPITPLFGLSASVQHARTVSNISNFRSTSWSGLIGPTLRF